MVVGESKELFYVHKGIFCKISPFFEAALSGSFREFGEQTISFPDTFEIFVQWVYTKSLSLPSIDTAGETASRYLILARLFVLADKLQVPVLKKESITIMYRSVCCAKWIPKAEVIQYACDQAQRNCGLRRLLVAVYVWRASYTWYDGDGCANDLSKLGDFSVELAVGLARRISHPERQSPFAGDGNPLGASEFYDFNPQENNYRPTAMIKWSNREE